MRLPFIKLVLLMVFLFDASVPVMASPYNQQQRYEQSRQFGPMNSGGMTLGGAVSQARQEYNGRVISAETEKSGRHNIKILTDDGRVKRLHYDSRNGTRNNGGNNGDMPPPKGR